MRLSVEKDQNTTPDLRASPGNTAIPGRIECSFCPFRIKQDGKPELGEPHCACGLHRSHRPHPFSRDSEVVPWRLGLLRGGRPSVMGVFLNWVWQLQDHPPPPSTALFVCV